jgi:DNA-binding response OmpR family regulator
MKILLVDDDADLLDVAVFGLRREGLTVVTATDGDQALTAWETERPHLVVVDAMLPKRSGFAVCHAIRQGSATPVILLTGRADDDHVSQGFDAGADDYVTKPFSTRALAMRIYAVWRRVACRRAPALARELRIRDLTLDVRAQVAYGGGGMVHLTPIECRLLSLLAANAGRVVSRQRLAEHVWGYGSGGGPLLPAHISNIRDKLNLGRRELGAVTGLGYRLDLAPAATAA